LESETGSDHSSKILLLTRIRDFDARINEAIRANDDSLVESFLLELDELITSAVLHWYTPGNGLIQLQSEFRLFSKVHLRDARNNPSALLVYLRDSIHRCLVIVDPRSIKARIDVIPITIVEGTRGYIVSIVEQINGCYAGGWYDACAVMCRRLLETLIIEAYESKRIEVEIKDSSGNYFYLSELISKILSQPLFNLGRNTKAALPKLKNIGDQSAHSRRFIAQRGDIDDLIQFCRTVVQELVFLSGLK
jgi:hypothetical protein